jgi:hypothetical protein
MRKTDLFSSTPTFSNSSARSLLRSMLFISCSWLIVSCGKSSTVSGGGTGLSAPSTGPGLADAGSKNPPTEISLQAATSLECVYGGTTVVTFKDLDLDGSFDQNDEPVLSKSSICNGSPGSQGFGAGLIVENAPPASCPAGGSILKTFVDKDNDGILGALETLSSITTLCNGIDGQNGSNGSNGASAHLSVSQASPAQCPSGGAVYSSFVDGDPSPTNTIVCNGANGTNGSNGQNGEDGEDAHYYMGKVGQNVSGKLYSACHHDYLYFPDNENGSKGWLTFRHQKNGSADQGIGSTGFQIWNVDIADFSLASEVGGVIYCNLHWDPVSKILSYTVVHNSDGLAGTQGQIAIVDP